MSPENVWRLAIALRARGWRWLARCVKNANSFLFHVSLANGAVIGDDLYLGHHGLGMDVHDNLAIADRVKIWQNVTLTVRAPAGSEHKIIIGDDVVVGANAVVVTPLAASRRIGTGARVGAVVVRDVPDHATVVGNPARVVRCRAPE